MLDLTLFPWKEFTPLNKHELRCIANLNENEVGAVSLCEFTGLVAGLYYDPSPHSTAGTFPAIELTRERS